MPPPAERLTKTPSATASGRSLHTLKGGGGEGGGKGGTLGKLYNASCQQHEDQMQEVLDQKVETLQADLSRRQESYIRRERAFNMRIEELEEEVRRLKAGKTSWIQGSRSMSSLKNMHQQILHNVEMVQDRSSKILQEQEKDLLRAFRARLFDVQIELEREKSRKDEGDSCWIERTRATEAKLDWAKETANRLDRVNQALSKDNLQLKCQFTSQEDDRKFLIKQLVAIKKENQSLRQEREAAEASMFEIQRKAISSSSEGVGAAVLKSRPRSSFSAHNHPGSSTTSLRQSPGGGTADADGRYKDIIKRLKRLLETERRNLRQVRSAYTAELQQRTELETMLRAAVEEVRQKMAARQKRAAKLGQSEKRDGVAATGEAPPPLSSPGSSVGGVMRRDGDSGPSSLMGAFSAGDREQTLEVLLSRERVLSLLYSKTFPLTSTPMSNTEDGDIDISTGGVHIGPGEASSRAAGGVLRESET